MTNNELNIRLTVFSDSSIEAFSFITNNIDNFSDSITAEITFKNHNWIYKISTNSSNDFYFDYIDHIKQLLILNRGTIIKLASIYEIELSFELFINVHSEDSIAPFHFDKELIQLLAELKIEVDFDIITLE